MLPLEISCLASSHGHWGFGLKHLENIFDDPRVEAEHVVLAGSHLDSPPQALWNSGQGAVVMRRASRGGRWHDVCPFEVTSGHL